MEHTEAHRIYTAAAVFAAGVSQFDLSLDTRGRVHTAICHAACLLIGGQAYTGLTEDGCQLASASTGDKWHTVSAQGRACSCKSYVQAGNYCWHRAAFRLLVALADVPTEPITDLIARAAHERAMQEREAEEREAELIAQAEGQEEAALQAERERERIAEETEEDHQAELAAAAEEYELQLAAARAELAAATDRQPTQRRSARRPQPTAAEQRLAQARAANPAPASESATERRRRVDAETAELFA